MPASVPTTQPPRGAQWHGWNDLVPQPAWMFARIRIWRPGYRESRTITPTMFVDQPSDLQWTPAGPLLSAAEVVKRLAR